ncbi:ESX secretion-associated protein EspG [Prauserella rugosa]|uniref:ESAT-6 protein secretion system EspG family protein n=1 Tax=Prauserella rugosa TaxID=43354 RepID=A0A660CFY3_9PSEU|nr:ESX secretion-associated protein EspG [Prauserella rugosa]KID29316.1 EspG family [Prauserella sp. Am3]KMS91101.1 hypothetical protein ACZ91_11425 [Streptomyces regensis]TWH21324.1 ESAT-6 protein secretion system EspG family protein [Prauserella rugosa]
MTVLTRPVTVPRSVLLHVWQLEGLGDSPPVFGADDIYVSQQRRAEHDRECFRLLEQLGVAHGDMLTREFRVALRILAAPSRELYCWSTVNGPGNGPGDGSGNGPGNGSAKRKFAAAIAGGEGVAVQVRGDLVSFVGFEERHFIDDFVSELPQYPAASVPEMHITRAAFEQRDERHDMFAAKQPPEKQLEKLMKAPRLGVHQVYVAGTVNGTHQRSKPFTVIDIRDQGRVLTFTDGRGDIHCLPGTPANLAKTFLATWQSMS